MFISCVQDKDENNVDNTGMLELLLSMQDFPASHTVPGAQKPVRGHSQDSRPQLPKGIFRMASCSVYIFGEGGGRGGP